MTSNIFISPENLKTQELLGRISDWTNKKKMKLNNQKTKNLIFNCSKNYQFSTDLKLGGEVIETVSETKLLGTIITTDLNWRNSFFCVITTDGSLTQVLFWKFYVTTDTKLFDVRSILVKHWRKNTHSLVKQSHKRMSFLHKASKFTSNVNDLKRIYMMQVRSKLEQSAVLWHFGLSQKNRNDLERVQKCSLFSTLMSPNSMWAPRLYLIHRLL